MQTAGSCGWTAAGEGWRSVALVTTAYHVRRVRLLVDRCYPGSVHPVGAPARVSAPETALKALREGAALVAALTFQRGC